MKTGDKFLKFYFFAKNTELYPQIVVLLGDRYELLSIASACVVLKKPIAHISGGEISEGAYDEYIRHALSKLSYLHFPQRKHTVGELYS